VKLNYILVQNQIDILSLQPC